jgi:hypothetical protein
MNDKLMPRAGRLIVPLLILGAAIPAFAGDPGDSHPDALATLIPELPRDHILEITLDNGSVHTGYLVRARLDSLTLKPWGDDPRSIVAVDEIIRIRERRSNAGRGFGWGAVSGALVGGSLGFLSGLYLSSINSREESDTGPVIGGTVVGAAVGAGIFGLTGWGIGALSRSWRTLYGDESLGVPGEDHAPTRLALDFGYGSLRRDQTTFDGFAARLGLDKPISKHMLMGPHFEYVSSDDSFHASFGMKAYLRHNGFGPYAAGGFGWYWGNGGYLGGHLGGGVRYLNHRGTDFRLDGRYHFNVSDIDKGSDAGYWTVTAGFSFEL